MRKLTLLLFALIAIFSLEIFFPSNCFASIKSDKILEITKIESDDFSLSYRYSQYKLFLGFWIEPNEYVLYYSAKKQYKPIGKDVPPKIVEYYKLENNTPQPSLIKKIWLYFWGFLFEIILSIVALSVIYSFLKKHISRYLVIRKKFKYALKNYTNAGGDDGAVLSILKFLSFRQKREIYVSFECNNELPPVDVAPIKDNDGNEINLHSPYKNFQKENLEKLESAIVSELNNSFSKIISNDVFRFVKGQSSKKIYVFFEIHYTVEGTNTTFKYTDKESNNCFLGIIVKWDFKVYLKRKMIKHLSFDSIPSNNFSVSQNATIKDVFDKMAFTAFVDLNNKLQSELKLQKL